jgi:16S rRNA (guanine966-N2)-methyltransferase
MSIRVIAGSAKGRRLKLVPGDTTRPVMDRVKESLFNIIGRDIFDAHFLDLFAGTGSVGIEALSRGAARATFVDIEKRAIETIKTNLAITNFTNRATIVHTDAFQYLEQEPKQAYRFIYVAPPQYKNLWLRTLHVLDAHPAWLSPDTEVIAQIDPAEAQPLDLKHLAAVDQRRYGNTLLLFLRYKTQTDAEMLEE